MLTPLGHGIGTRVDVRAGEKSATGQNTGKGGSTVVVCEVVGEKNRVGTRTRTPVRGGPPASFQVAIHDRSLSSPSLERVIHSSTI